MKFKEEPTLVLPGGDELMEALCFPMEGPDRFKVRSNFLVETIKDMHKTREFVSDQSIMIEACRILRLRPPSEEGPKKETHRKLEVLIYNAKHYYAHDKLLEDGFVPFTQELIDQAFLQDKLILIGLGITSAPMRKEGKICAQARGSRTKFYVPDRFIPAKLINKPTATKGGK